jgi:dipeptidyl aminopeptidase/acylaminoacyl peptidase
VTQNDGFERRLTAWLDSEAAPHAPADLGLRFAEDMGHAGQRRGWATTERWISMETRAHLGAVPRTAIVIVILGLLLALAAGAIFAGGSKAANGLIAFGYQGDIYTVQPDGSDRQLLVDAPEAIREFAWSLDGKRLAYWSYTYSDGPSRLWVVDADGSNPVTIVSEDVSVSGYGVPAWSPDGSQLAFSARTVGGPQTACVGSSDAAPSFCSSRIFVAAADGSTGAVQVGHPDLAARSVAWSPDGKTIAFNGGDAEKGSGLYLMNRHGTDVRRLGQVSGTGWAFLRLGWSPDGTSIAASAGMDSLDMWVFEADGTGETKVSEPPADPAVPMDQGFPAYAADGTLAWGGGVAPPGGLVLLEEGGVPVTLPGFMPVDSWSPDGLLMATTMPDAVGNLIIIDREGAIRATIEDIGLSVSSWQRLPG